MNAKLLLVLFSSAALVAACAAELDGGSTSEQPGVGGGEIDGAAIDGAPGASVTTLTLDDVPCTLSEPPESYALSWPAWGTAIDAACGAVGHIHVWVDSNASVPYPQTCGPVTSVSLGIDSDGDAGAPQYHARSGRGSCTVASGPNLSEPSAPVGFSATVVHDSSTSRTHRVVYQAGTP
jgi:hypothetical protein